MNIRQEQRRDWLKVEELIQRAFEKDIHSDHQEQFLVKNLRNSIGFIPELSLVATEKDKIIGYVLLTEVFIAHQDKRIPTLSLAPLAVSPEFQSQGIGSSLMQEAHKMAKVMGFQSIIILGDPKYYTRFGYHPLKEFQITLPFHVPEEYCLGVELCPNAFQDVKGKVIYPKAFFE